MVDVEMMHWKITAGRARATAKRASRKDGGTCARDKRSILMGGLEAVMRADPKDSQRAQGKYSQRGSEAVRNDEEGIANAVARARKSMVHRPFA